MHPDPHLARELSRNPMHEPLNRHLQLYLSHGHPLIRDMSNATSMIEYKSLATETRKEHSTMPPISMVSLAEYMSACLDSTQQATRATLATPPCPPSGQGSEHETIRPTY